MGIPFSCKIGKHTWSSLNDKGIKDCKFCNSRKYVGEGVKENTRCNIGFHVFENKVRGKVNTCKRCGRKLYVNKLSEIGNSSWDYDAGA
jgi:hypothetical protein